MRPHAHAPLNTQECLMCKHVLKAKDCILKCFQSTFTRAELTTVPLVCRLPAELHCFSWQCSKELHKTENISTLLDTPEPKNQQEAQVKKREKEEGVCFYLSTEVISILYQARQIFNNSLLRSSSLHAKILPGRRQ